MEIPKEISTDCNECFALTKDIKKTDQNTKSDELDSRKPFVYSVYIIICAIPFLSCKVYFKPQGRVIPYHQSYNLILGLLRQH